MQHQYFGKPSYSPSPLYLLLQHLLCVKGPVFSAAHLFAPCVTHQWTFEQLVVVKRERGGQRGAESPWHVLEGGCSHWHDGKKTLVLTCCHNIARARARATTAVPHLPWLCLPDWIALYHLLVILKWNSIAERYLLENIPLLSWLVDVYQNKDCVLSLHFFFFLLWHWIRTASVLFMVRRGEILVNALESLWILF